MEQQNQISRIAIQFGDDIDGGHKQYLQAKLTINKDTANAQQLDLENKTSNQITIPWSAIIAINVTEQNQQQIETYLQKLQEKDTTHDNFSFYTFLVEKQSKGYFQVNHVKAGQKLYISLKLGQDFEEEAKGTFEQFFENGLNAIASDQSNSIDVSLSSGTSADEFIQKVSQGESVSSVLMENMKFECKVNMHENLGESLKGVMQGVDEEFANSPPFVLLKYFKSLDVDMKFSSTKDLPENIRKNVFLGKMLGGEELKVDLSEYKAFPLLESLDTEVEVFVTIPDFCVFNVVGHNLAVSKFLQNYGNYGGLFKK